MSDETVNPISGTKSLKYEAGASSLDDWVIIENLVLEDKQKGETLGITGYADMSNMPVNVDLRVKTDSGLVLTSLGTDVLLGGKDKGRFSISVGVPSNAVSIDYGFHIKNAPTSGDNFVIDDIEISLNPFNVK